MNEDLPRRVAARTGITWIAGAFKLFLKSPLILSAGTAIFLGALLILQFLPVAGPWLTEIITPMIVAGFMRAFRTIDDGEDPELPHLLTGFSKNSIPLATVGAIYLGILIAIMALMKILGVDYEAIMQSLEQGASIEQIAAELEGKSGLLLFGTALILPAVAATWFAPALILFGNAAPLQAMKLSLKASLRNWLPLLVCGLACIPILLLAALPIVGLLVLVPVMLGTAYLGYQSMFAYQDSGVREQGF